MSVAIHLKRTQDFDLIDKRKVKAAFSAAAQRYDEVAELQRKVGHVLLEKIVQITPELQVFADIGCGTGHFTSDLVHEISAQQVIALDIAQTMLFQTCNRLSPNTIIDYICADAEYLPLAQHSIDAIYSNLALQWCVDLSRLFKGFKRVLKPAGQIAFSTFGPATLQELKKAWSYVDDYAHVNDFYSTDQLFEFLQQTGFDNIQMESRCYQSNYSSVLDLMRELKNIGAHNVLPGRNKKITRKGQMQAMISAYERYRVNNLIPATYQVVFVQAGVAH